MLYIYKFTNKINGKIYIGQTNDITKRIRGHKSDVNNIKSHNYQDAFHAALRKYGWDNFDFEIVEEIDDSFGRDYLNERERFFISFYHSRVSENGYNITAGGDGHSVAKKSFADCCSQSKILNEQIVRDVQAMLLDGYQYFEIKKKYKILTDSFLTNINAGLNFYRDDLEYPLSMFHSKFSKDSQQDIINRLKSGEKYDEIIKIYPISKAYLSQINHGERWFNKNETYPLFKLQNSSKFSHGLKKDLIFSDIAFNDLAMAYGKTCDYVKKVNCGHDRKDKRLLYPLRENAEQNKKIWNTLF